jgi:hypothetical protein
MAAEIVAVCPEEKTNMPELTSPLIISSTSTPRRGESPADRQTLLQSRPLLLKVISYSLIALDAE